MNAIAKITSVEDLVLRRAIEPALDWLSAYGIQPSNGARVMLGAICGQEAGWTERRQKPSGHALGLWQFERTGCRAVLTHERTRDVARTVCAEAGVEANPTALWGALEEDDMLAAAIARLLLWSDPASLPLGPMDGWTQYQRTWRPGKPRRHHWGENWRRASEAVRKLHLLAV